MIDEWQIIGETDFKIIDKKELEEVRNEKWEMIIEDTMGKWWNLRDDLIELGLLNYENLNEEEKKVFDELQNEKRDSDFYDL